MYFNLSAHQSTQAWGNTLESDDEHLLGICWLPASVEALSRTGEEFWQRRKPALTMPAYCGVCNLSGQSRLKQFYFTTFDIQMIKYKFDKRLPSTWSSSLDLLHQKPRNVRKLQYIEINALVVLRKLGNLISSILSI